MIFQLIVVLVAFLQVVSSAEWAVVSGTSATIVVGVGATGNVAVSASESNGSGAYLGYYDGTSWTKEPYTAGMTLDAAITSKGTRVVVGTWPTWISQDGETFTRGSVSGTSQSVNAYGSNDELIAMTGVFTLGDKAPTPGVASSTDGVTWSLSSSIPTDYARYGAFPSESTWYVSSGMWGADPVSSSSASNSTARGLRELSSRVSILDGALVIDSSASSLVKNQRNRRAEKGFHAATQATTGWFGAVSKTTDGGKTWSQVFSSDLETDYYYFNQIDCSSETNCVVVGEGENSDGSPYIVAYTTVDGGNTWTKTLSTSDISLMAVKFSSSSDVWLGGITTSGRQTVGQFWKSTDGGLTFARQQTLSGCLPFDIDFSNGVGYTACTTASGSSCSVAMYQ